METKFNWKLPLYGVIGFALGSIIFTAGDVFNAAFELTSADNAIIGYIIGFVCVVLWGGLGGASLGLGMFGKEDKGKILRLAVAGASGFLFGLAALLLSVVVLLGPGFLIGFPILISVTGIFLGMGLKSKRYGIYLAGFGVVAGIITDIVVLGIGYIDLGLRIGVIDFYAITLSITAGFFYGLALAYVDYKPLGTNKINKWILFIAIAIISGLVLASAMQFLFPPKIVENVGCCGKIVTTQKFQLFLSYMKNTGFYTYTYIEYEKDGRTFENYFDNSMRLSLEWINQNTEDDAVLLNWWDYGHMIRGYTYRDSVIYAPSADMLGTVANMEWIPEKQGDFSPGEKIADVGYALLTSNPDETLQIMDKYNAGYLYVYTMDWGKSWAIYEAIKDDVGSKLTINFSALEVPTKEEDEVKDEISKMAKDEDEKNKLISQRMSELYKKRLLEMLGNTTLGRVLNKEKIEGLELVYSDKSAVIYKKI